MAIRFIEWGKMMSKERELLQRIIDGDTRGDFFISNELLKEIDELLILPDQEPVTNEPTTTAMAVMPNGVCVSFDHSPL